MSRENFEANTQELLSAINDTWDNQHIMPGLIMLYSGIDIMAWLNRPAAIPDVREADFINWVDIYLIPHYPRTIRAVDIYGARCSVLHSYTARSRRSRQGRARQVLYAWGTARAEDLQQAIDGLWQDLIDEARQVIAAFGTGLLTCLQGTADGSTLERITRLTDYFGLDQLSDLQTLVDDGIAFTPIAVHIDELFDAFVEGLGQFTQDLAANSNQADLVYGRANKFFSHIPIAGVAGT